MADVPHILGSWKEIARHLGRGVRTVQRWEAELGLPVHRVPGRRRGAVMAFASEVDLWLGKTQPAALADPSPQPAGVGPLLERSAALHQLLERVGSLQRELARATHLYDRMAQLQRNHNRRASHPSDRRGA